MHAGWAGRVAGRGRRGRRLGVCGVLLLGAVGLRSWRYCPVCLGRVSVGRGPP